MKEQLNKCSPFWRMYLLHCKSVGVNPSEFINLKNWIEGI